jgi:hypothetical protein
MYDTSDPRSMLAPAPVKPAPFEFAAADCGKFYETAPQENDGNGKSWYIRSQNTIVIYSDAADGARFVREAQADEYVLLLPERNVSAEVTTAAGTTAVAGYSIVFIPAGRSEIRISGQGQVVRLYTTRSQDFAAKCVNAQSYATPHPNVAPFQAWPEPATGARVRVYTLDVPDEPGRFDRIWRGSTLMVNYLPPQLGPRDVKKLSPHHHDDFEQISLALDGAFTHHLRWPWTTNLNNWREDQHEYCASPSVLVIPPPAIHTSRGMLASVNQLVDIFCPPRMDFSLKPGWVLNAEDYPLPANA